MCVCYSIIKSNQRVYIYYEVRLLFSKNYAPWFLVISPGFMGAFISYVLRCHPYSCHSILGFHIWLNNSHVIQLLIQTLKNEWFNNGFNIYERSTLPTLLCYINVRVPHSPPPQGLWISSSRAAMKPSWLERNQVELEPNKAQLDLAWLARFSLISSFFIMRLYWKYKITFRINKILFGSLFLESIVKI